MNQTIESLVEYLGLNKKIIMYWKRKGFDWFDFVDQLKKCTGFGNQKKLFYEAFGVYTAEGRIDVIWNRFVNHQFVQEEIEKENIIKKKKLDKIKEERKQGRVV
jgi:hypothetical protein